MPFKPMARKAYEKWIGQFGWTLVDAGNGNFSLLNEKGKIVKPFIKVTHPGTPHVIADHVNATRKLLKDGGFNP